MKVLLIAVSLMTAVAVAQTPKFVDNSPAGSPIKFSKTSRSPEGNCYVTEQNQDAGHEAMAAVFAEFRDGDGHFLFTSLVDHYFRDDAFIKMHGGEFEAFFPCSGWKTVNMNVKLVQYSDGTLWAGSDQKSVEHLLAERKDTTEYDKEVVANPTIMANDPMKTEKGPATFTRGGEWWNLKNTANPQAAANERLANAVKHKTWTVSQP